MYSTPILFIIFTRLDTAQKVFERIRQIQPSRLFIAADGPRSNKQGEKEKCETVRKWVTEHIDWNCKVNTLFRDANLGCGKAVSSAITWFFNNVEQGIILEDDCVPSLSFFHYCETLLEYYKNTPSVWHVAGHNTMGINPRPNNESYSFSAIEACWGWATWRDRWQNYKYDIATEDIGQLSKHAYFRKKYRKEYWFHIFNGMSSSVNDIWDYQWTYLILKNLGYCAIPAKNLIENVGFGADSTHFSDGNNSLYAKSYELDTIIHPKQINYDWKLIKYTDKKVFGIPSHKSIWLYGKNILKLILKKLHLFNFIKKMLKNESAI